VYDMETVRSRSVMRVKLVILVTGVLFCAASCSCWNVMQPSRSIKIPPYRIEYYHSDAKGKLSSRTKETKGWYEQPVNDQLTMHYQITRVEESGIYFYQLLYRAVNAGDTGVAIYDQNIALIDSATMVPIEQLQCWNWQKVSVSCNRAEVAPGGEMVKEIRFGYSVDERYAPGLSMKVSGLGATGEAFTIDFHAP